MQTRGGSVGDLARSSLELSHARKVKYVSDMIVRTDNLQELLSTLATCVVDGSGSTGSSSGKKDKADRSSSKQPSASQLRDSVITLAHTDIEQIWTQTGFELCRRADHDNKILLGAGASASGSGGTGCGKSKSKDKDKDKDKSAPERSEAPMGTGKAAPFCNIFMPLPGDAVEKAKKVYVRGAGTGMDVESEAESDDDGDSDDEEGAVQSNVTAKALSAALGRIEAMFASGFESKSAIAEQPLSMCLPVAPDMLGASMSPVVPGFAGSWDPDSDDDDANGGDGDDGAGYDESEHTKVVLKTASKLNSLLDLHGWSVRERTFTTRGLCTGPATVTSSSSSVTMSASDGAGGTEGEAVEAEAEVADDEQDEEEARSVAEVFAGLRAADFRPSLNTNDLAIAPGLVQLVEPILGATEAMSPKAAADRVRVLPSSSSAAQTQSATTASSSSADTIDMDTIVKQRCEDTSALFRTLSDVTEMDSASAPSPCMSAGQGASRVEHLTGLGLGCCLVSGTTAVEDRMASLLPLVHASVSDPVGAPILVVCRSKDLYDWKMALHDADVNAIVYDGTALQRSATRTTIVSDHGSLYCVPAEDRLKHSRKVLVTSYEHLSTDLLYFQSYIWHVAVYDKPWGLTPLDGLSRELFSLPCQASVVTTDAIALARKGGAVAPHPAHLLRILLPGCLPGHGHVSGLSVGDLLRLAACLTSTPDDSPTGGWRAWTQCDPTASGTDAALSLCFATEDEELCVAKFYEIEVDVDMVENVILPRFVGGGTNDGSDGEAALEASPGVKRGRSASKEIVEPPAGFKERVSEADVARARRHVVKKSDRWHVSRFSPATDTERFLGTFGTFDEGVAAYVHAGRRPSSRVAELKAPMPPAGFLNLNGYACSSDPGPSAYARLILTDGSGAMGNVTSSVTVLRMMPPEYMVFAESLGVLDVFGMPCNPPEDSPEFASARGMVMGAVPNDDTDDRACGVLEWSNALGLFTIRPIDEDDEVPVYLNGVPVKQATSLKNGDVVQCGEVQMLFGLPEKGQQAIPPSHYLMGPNEHRFKLLKNLLANTLEKEKIDPEPDGNPNPIPITADLLSGASRQLKGQNYEQWINTSSYGFERRKLSSGRGETSERRKSGAGGQGKTAAVGSQGSGSSKSSAASKSASATNGARSWSQGGRVVPGQPTVTKSLSSILASRKRVRADYNGATQARLRTAAQSKRRKTKKSNTVFAFGCTGYRSASDSRKDDVLKVLTDWENTRMTGLLGGGVDALDSSFVMSKNSGVVMVAPWNKLPDAGLDESYTDIFKGSRMDQVLWGNEGHGDLGYNLLTTPYLERSVINPANMQNPKPRVRKPTVSKEVKEKEKEKQREREKIREKQREMEMERGRERAREKDKGVEKTETGEGSTGEYGGKDAVKEKGDTDSMDVEDKDAKDERTKMEEVGEASPAKDGGDETESGTKEETDADVNTGGDCESEAKAGRVKVADAEVAARNAAWQDGEGAALRAAADARKEDARVAVRKEEEKAASARAAAAKAEAEAEAALLTDGAICDEAAAAAAAMAKAEAEAEAMVDNMFEA